MLSPNTRLDDLTQEQMQDIGLSATGSSQLGTAGNPVVIPRITSTTNLRLRWGEWLRIAITSVLAAAVAIEAVFFVMSAIWFGDLRHALLPFGPLALTLFIAALVMHFPETVPALRRAEPVVFVAGITITALVLIRLFAVAGLAPGDLSWIAAFAHIADLYAEQPHTILGMIGISVISWIMGVRLARLGGNYEKRRAAFIGFLALMMGAAGLGLIIASDGRSDLSGTLAIMLPLYMFLGLVTLGQVRLTEVLRRATSASASRRQVALWRLMTALLSLFAILFVVLAGLIFYTRSYTQGLDLLLTIAGTIFFFLVTVIFWILSPLLNILGTGGNAFSQAAQVCTPTPVGAGSAVPTATPTVTTTPTPASCVKPIQLPTGGQYIHVSPQLVYIIIALLLITAGCLLAYLFLRRTANSETGDAYEEIQESLNIRGHLQGQQRGAALAPAFDTPAAGTVRAAYRGFLQSSAGSGLARQSTETAAEFERRVTATMPEDTAAQPASSAAVAHLTVAYQDERYGAVKATPGRFAQAQALAQMLAGILAPPRIRLPRRNRAPAPATEITATAKQEPFIQRWGLQGVGSIVLLGLDVVYLRFVGGYRPLNAHGIIAGLLILGVGLLTIALPIGAATLAFMTLNLNTTKYTIAAKGIAALGLFLSLIILVPSSFTAISILIKAVSLIF